MNLKIFIIILFTFLLSGCVTCKDLRLTAYKNDVENLIQQYEQKLTSVENRLSEAKSAYEKGTISQTEYLELENNLAYELAEYRTKSEMQLQVVQARYFPEESKSDEN